MFVFVTNFVKGVIMRCLKSIIGNVYTTNRVYIINIVEKIRFRKDVLI